MRHPDGFRIVHVIPHLRWAAGHYVLETAIEQQRRWPGRVAIVLSGDLGFPQCSDHWLVHLAQSAGVFVTWVGDFFSRDLSALQYASSLIRAQLLADGEWAPDAVVHAHTAMAAVAARRALAPRVVCSVHGPVRARRVDIELQDALALELCDAVLAPSEHGARTLRTQVSAHKVTVAPFAVQASAVTPALAGTGRRVVSVDTWNEASDAVGLIDAMTRVWRRVPDATLHLLGNGPCLETLRSRALAIDPTGKRILVEPTAPDSVVDYSAYDLFASAHTADYTPFDLFRAMAARLPIVTTWAGGPVESVAAARCGLVVPDGSVDDLAIALTVLLDASPSARAALGSAGRQFLDSHLTPAAHMDRLEAIYAGHLEQRWTPPAGEVKLHLGSGPDRRDGWVNVDARPAARPDIVSRAHALPMIPDGCVDVVEACHLFEHLPLHETGPALREWARVLKPGGRLFLELPDFQRSVELLGCATDDNGFDLGMIGIFGWPTGVERDGDEWTHRWGWTPRTLEAALDAAGFEQIVTMPITQDNRPAARYARDFRIGAVKRAVSLASAA